MSDPKAWQGAELAELARKVKQQLRARMKATRSALPKAAVATRSNRIIAQLERLEVFRQARSVALFWPVEEQGEVDLRELDAALEKRGVARFYPFMVPSEAGHTTGFRRIDDTSELVLSRHKFRQPERGANAARGDVDIVLVPALAVTPSGHRLGYGTGFYDVTLPDVCPPARSVALAYAFQLLAELPVEDHDHRCDMVVTDEAVFDTELRADTE